MRFSILFYFFVELLVFKCFVIVPIDYIEIYKYFKFSAAKYWQCIATEWNTPLE